MDRVKAFLSRPIDRTPPEQNSKSVPDTACPAPLVYLKEIIAVGAVEFTREHAAPLEI
jgi:hypothetical protein